MCSFNISRDCEKNIKTHNQSFKSNLRTMAGRVIVYGGKGALGSSLVSFFKSKSWVRKMIFKWYTFMVISTVGSLSGYIS